MLKPHASTRRPTALRYAAAVAIVALAMAVRAALEPVLQGEAPFVPFFAATAAAAESRVLVIVF